MPRIPGACSFTCLRSSLPRLSLSSFAEEIHNLECTPHQLRQIHNLFLEPLAQLNTDLAYNQKLDKLLSLTIMFLGTMVPMLHMFGAGQQQTVAISALVPIMQGVNMNLQPHAKCEQLTRVRSACISEGHHFMSLTGEYHEAQGHDDHEIKHFLEMIESHRSVKTKPKKKDKKGKKDKK